MDKNKQLFRGEDQMKKLILGLLFLIMAQPVFANDYYADRARDVPIRLSGTIMSGATVNSIATSDTIVFEKAVGFATLYVNQTAGAGDVDIFAEYSFDDSNWFRPYTTDMAGTITIEGDIVTALTQQERWIVFTPRMAKYIRFTFDPDANSTVTASLIYLRGK